MYAVILTGGKQYRVSQGDILKIETLPIGAGETFHFNKVLMRGAGEQVEIGSPYLEGAQVSAIVMSHGRHKKIQIIKFKRRKHHMKRQGHRQNYTQVKITAISQSNLS